MEYKNEMAQQFNGATIHSLLESRHNIYNEAEEFILHRTNLSVDNATEEELILIGKFLCIPRPYQIVEGEPVECSVDFYRMFIKNVAMLKFTRSLLDFSTMISQFMPDGYYIIEFSREYAGDILLTVDERYSDYVEFFQQAVDLIFNTLPKIRLTPPWEFSAIVRNHSFYSHIASLIDGDWVSSYENHSILISFPNRKYSVLNHKITVTIQ